MNNSQDNSANKADLELALQEFAVENLEDLNAPGWSDVLSAISGASVGASISYSVVISLAT